MLSAKKPRPFAVAQRTVLWLVAAIVRFATQVIATTGIATSRPEAAVVCRELSRDAASR